jgi:hypothetical protein
VGVDARSLPPRHALPRDVEIPRLTGLGLTWYDRGGRYWARRVWLSLMWAILLAIIGAIDAGFFSAMNRSSHAGFGVFIVIDAVLSVGLLAWGAIQTARRWNVAKPPRRASQPRLRFGPGPAGQLLASLAQLGYWLLILIVAIAMLFVPGLFIFLFLSSLLPETLAERQARLLMAERLAERGLIPQTGAGA